MLTEAAPGRDGNDQRADQNGHIDQHLPPVDARHEILSGQTAQRLPEDYKRPYLFTIPGSLHCPEGDGIVKAHLEKDHVADNAQGN